MLLRTNINHYSFGSPMPGRSYQSSVDKYRYGMNGKEKDDEIVGSGNSYDFGARQNDPRLGRWWSVDPEYKQYPHASPYSAFGNNPNYYIDPGGETLRVAGDAKAREAVRVQLQKLTNDKVIVQSDGLVKVIAGNQNPSKKLVNGTQLLQDVTGHKKETEIIVGPDKVENGKWYTSDFYQHNNSNENATNGVGSDGYIIMGADVQLLEKDPKTNKTAFKKVGKAIGLATELIHALKGMDGKQRKESWVESNEYTTPDGKTKTEAIRREELETHGLGGATNYDKNGKAYVNENDIRKEQGRNPRASYSENVKTSPIKP